MITLVLGGTRSGKSGWAEERVRRAGERVTYVATARRDGDETFERRIDDHQRRRSPTWTTVEIYGDLAAGVAALSGPVLIDSLSTWLAGQENFAVAWTPLAAALRAHHGDVVLVSDEVGLGLLPSNELGRRFLDALGDLNQRVAELADEVFLVVSGQAMRLKPATSP